MTNRREFMIGTGCVVAAGAAYAGTPRNRVTLIGAHKLEELLPAKFGDWIEVPSDALVVPQSEDSLAAKLYSQTLGRIYEGKDGRKVMMLIAYGDTQSDSLQLHRPEVCYPAFGFSVAATQPRMINVGRNVAVPGRALTATSPIRTEHIAYWTRIGEYLPQSGPDQRIAKLRCAFAGIVPDGVLVRISNIEPDAETAFALSQTFAAAMIEAFAASGRPAMIGTALSKLFAA